jgi:hypothetical protein
VKIALYPCCGSDFDVPSILLAKYAELVLFCDVKASNLREYDQWSRQHARASPIETRFSRQSVWKLLATSPKLTTFFYRRDSSGEGGSGIQVFGDEFMSLLMSKFSSIGYIISDGSNSVDGIFSQMLSMQGLERYGYIFSSSCEQPFLDEFKLHLIEVRQLSDVGNERRYV